jgi:hypothetical protein
MAFDGVNWTKLMQILKETGTDGRERRLIANCTWIRVLNYDWTRGRLDHRDIRNVNIGKGVKTRVSFVTNSL